MYVFSKARLSRKNNTRQIDQMPPPGFAPPPMSFGQQPGMPPMPMGFMPPPGFPGQYPPPQWPQQ
ncbi:hypothetical protein BCR33DRAFT_696491 [Rhizoclosmatium globosum]|uniref:Uncharacterized protein n=1 Tax=Rhizoclosmatium globosum TaxID=329046 RepID=A0A1Y2CID8_9FUNG|nr:hypothetical protein BCR33DRAFT_696491 [Rhizoclosmatium globosum]|eukprot:ORY46782.1 hypothetical protein BCR33DRAFT_696491 [Rhizoclosmatium globosum]